jgi:hypothetical protein
MRIPPRLPELLADMVRRRNRELASEALMQALSSIIFTSLAFGLVFYLGWYGGTELGPLLGLDPWLFGAGFGVFFLVLATLWSWERSEPATGFEPLTPQQLIDTLQGRAKDSAIPLGPEPRSDLTMLFFGGPAGVIKALSVWNHRLRADDDLIDEAARLLAECRDGCPIEQVCAPAAAVLLRRLALIKVMNGGESVTLKLTDKGYALLEKASA